MFALFKAWNARTLWKRFSLLLLMLATACIVSTPRDARDDGNGEVDAGTRDAGVEDGGSGEDAGVGDAGETDAGETDGGEADAGSVDDGGTDGGPFVFPRRWGPPTAITELNTVSYDWLPSMTEDMLRLCFASDRTGSLGSHDIYCASRSQTSDPFGTPVNQANINSSNTDDVSVIWRGELYFSSNRPGGKGSCDIYHAQWSAIVGSYVSPTPVTELNTSSCETPRAITADGLTLYLASDRPGTLGFSDLWVSTRSTTSSAWSTPINVASLNTAQAYDWSVSLAPDESFLLLVSERSGGNPSNWVWIAEANPAGGWQTPMPADIQRPGTCFIGDVKVLPNGWLVGNCTEANKSPDLYLFPPREPDPPSKFQWGTPVPVTELNTSAYETQPTMTADLLKICFGSDRAGGKGDLDIWCATRASTTVPFGAPVNQTALNSSGFEAHPALSSDGTELFYSAGGDINRAVWVPADNAFKFPEAVTPLNTTLADGAPVLTSNDLTIVFASDRQGSAGSADLYLAVRSTRSSAFGSPVRLTDLNGTYAELEPAASPDGFTLLFDSNRPILTEQGKQIERLFGATLDQGVWSTPELVQVDGIPDGKISGAHLLPDGSILFHRSTAQANDDLFIAPPK